MGQIKPGVNLVRLSGFSYILKGAGAETWATDIQIVYRAHPTTGGWQSLQPNNSGSFDAFTTLDNGGTYYIHGVAGITPFEVAGINAAVGADLTDLEALLASVAPLVGEAGSTTIQLDRIGGRLPLAINVTALTTFTASGAEPGAWHVQPINLSGSGAIALSGFDVILPLGIDLNTPPPAGYYQLCSMVAGDGIKSVNIPAYPVATSETPGNVAPVANAGADDSITLPTDSYLLMGGGTDADGTISSAAWSQIIGPNTATLSATDYSNTTAISATASALIEGTYVFRLTVTDNEAATHYDDVTLVVNAEGATQLNIPGSFTATAAGEDTINLTWTDTNS